MSSQVPALTVDFRSHSWGQCCICGVAASGKEISTRPFQLITGRRWFGTAYGGVKGKTELPGMVDAYTSGKLPLQLDAYVTHTTTLTDIEKGFGYMKQGDCIRCVVDMSK